MREDELDAVRSQWQTRIEQGLLPFRFYGLHQEDIQTPASNAMRQPEPSNKFVAEFTEAPSGPAANGIVEMEGMPELEDTQEWVDTLSPSASASVLPRRAPRMNLIAQQEDVDSTAQPEPTASSRTHRLPRRNRNKEPACRTAVVDTSPAGPSTHSYVGKAPPSSTQVGFILSEIL